MHQVRVLSASPASLIERGRSVMRRHLPRPAQRVAGDRQQDDQRPESPFPSAASVPRKTRAGPIVPSSSDAEQRADQRSPAAGNRDAADDDGGNHLQFQAGAGGGIDRRRIARR